MTSLRTSAWEASFDKVRAEIEKLRQEFKHEIDEMKHEIQSNLHTRHSEGEGRDKYANNEGRSGRVEQENCGSRRQ